MPAWSPKNASNGYNNRTRESSMRNNAPKKNSMRGTTINRINILVRTNNETSTNNTLIALANDSTYRNLVSPDQK